VTAAVTPHTETSLKLEKNCGEHVPTTAMSFSGFFQNRFFDMADYYSDVCTNSYFKSFSKD